MRLRYLAPNAVTCVSLAVALGSILAASRGQVEWAAWFILWSTLLDKADGAVARMLDASSEFGVQLDSLADLVAFGVAPAALSYATLVQAWQGESPPAVAVAAVIAFTLCAALRLARFNVATNAAPSNWFQGIPSTLAGGLVASGLLTAGVYEMPAQAMRIALPVALVALGLLMVSSLRMPKVGARSSRGTKAIQGGLLAFAYVAGFLRVVPEALFGVGLFFLLAGLAAGARRRPEAAS